MATIRECVDRFVANDKYSDRDHAIAKDWLEATKCGDVDVRVLTKEERKLDEDEQKQRNDIQVKTLNFIRRYFDKRPEVVKSLDNLFADFGLSDDRKRRDEFFAFDDLYSHDEVVVLLLRQLHREADSGRYTQANMADDFLTSTKTIGKYIDEMRHTEVLEEKARVFGQVVEMDPARITNVPDSTTHPLFLPLSMLELYALVDLLAAHVDDKVTGNVIKTILKRVYSQTTEYAQKRLARIRGLDKALSSIELLSEQMDLGEDLLFDEKENIAATIWYEKKGTKKRAEGYISRSRRDGETIEITGEDGVIRIPFHDITGVKPHRE